MNALKSSPRLSAIALSVAALFATPMAHADNYVGTSAGEGGNAVGGVTSGDTNNQANLGNTRIYAGSGNSVLFFNTNTIAGAQPTMSVGAGLVAINTGLQADSAVVGTTLTVGGATSLAGTTIAGATSINTTGTAVTTIGSATGTTNVNGATRVTGTTTIAGATSINTTGSLVTTIGSASSATSVGGALSVAGATTASGTLTVTGATTANSTLTVAGATTMNNTLRVNGATTANGTLAVSGMTTTNGIDNTGTLDQVGATNINTTGSAATHIGNAASATHVGGTLDVAGQTSTHGLANAGTLANTGAFVQTGVSTLVGATSVTGATTINTTGAALTTIGNASSGTNIGGTLQVTGQTSTHGQDNTGTFANTGAFNQTGVSTLVGATSVTGTTQINTSGTAATTIGHAGNTAAVTLASGASTVSVNNQSVGMTAGSSLASNGTTGTTGSAGSGGFVAYQTAPAPVANGESVGNVLSGAVYVNRISGNTLVDGNVYINGTLNYVSSNSATTTVTDGRISAGNSIVTAGQLGMTIDANGRLVQGQTDQGTAALTVTNAAGNTHGLVVTESQATLSGGTHSTSLTLNDTGARFSNATNGAPVTVTGVANGRGDFDAVNLRQFAGAVAAVGAAANIPATDPGKTASVGVGVSHFMGKSALAVGGHYRVAANTVVKASLAAGLNKGTSKPVIGVGAGISW